MNIYDRIEFDVINYPSLYNFDEVYNYIKEKYPHEEDSVLIKIIKSHL